MTRNILIVAVCGSFFVAGLTTVSIVEYVELQDQKVRATIEMIKLQQETSRTDKLNATKSVLLEEHDTCITQAETTYEEQWALACHDHPSEQRADGTCHTLHHTLAQGMADFMKDNKDRCENNYRNKMMALGVRQ